MSSHRRLHRSPAASPLDDDDLLSEILLRLSPEPSSLPRASLVCKRWRLLVSDPGFCRRFRRHHHRNPPLLGYFKVDDWISFVPTLEVPNRVSPERFSLQRGDDGRFVSLGCRHGLLLIFLPNRLQLLVWDPFTGHQHRLVIPLVLATCATKTLINGAVYRAAGDVQHFHVVLVTVDGDGEQHRRALASVCSSKTGLWGNLMSTPVQYQAHRSWFPTIVNNDDPVLAGESLYWVLAGNLDGILEFDLEKQSLAVIQDQVPADVRSSGQYGFKLMRAEGGGLGLISMSDEERTIQLWKRTADSDGIASWVLGRTIELDKLLSLKPEETKTMGILGVAEDNNVLLLWTVIGLFTVHLESLKFQKVHLESLKFQKLIKAMTMYRYHPFESVYTAETGIVGRHDASDLMHNK